MEEPSRPNPDSLLEKIKESDGRKHALKIFFGMSAGVGKTYTMLKEARLLRERGEDVVIGWLESHGRPETESLAVGIPAVPRKTVEYRGIRIEEMDLDGILARKPGIVLVDELAHSNTPGLKHPKRYQDVLDMLDAGIEVYTTVNIQHLESISDVVEELAGVPIRERVPDSVFDAASEIQLVDIPPEELLERLAEGKVYTGDKSEDAVSNFFKKENLAVLRELALKHATQLASHQLSNILRGEVSSLSAQGSQHVLVAISASPTSDFIIRWARRFTYTLKSSWTAIHVSGGAELSDSDKESLTRNITLARNLGANVVELAGEDVVAALLEYANQNMASAIVVGKSGIETRKAFFPKRASLSERLVRESGRITVIAVQEKPSQEAAARQLGRRIKQAPPGQYAIVLATVCGVTILNFLITPFAGYLSASIIYLAAIIILSIALDRFPVFVAAVLSALAWDLLFIPPRYTFVITKVEDILMLFLYFLIALSSSWMTARLKDSERMLKVREKRMMLINELSEKLESATSPESAARMGMDYITRAFGREALVFLRKEDEMMLQEEPIISAKYIRNEREISAAHFCFTSGEATGKFTSTLPVASYHYVPMAAPGGTIGVIGIGLDGYRTWTGDQETFLLTLASTLSLAVQREVLYERNRRNLLLEESERLSRILLHSVSHELRTPLTVIQGSATALLDPETALDEGARHLLIEDVLGATETLNRIVESILSMNRLESGRLRLNLSEVDPEELVALALEQVRKELGWRKVSVTKSAELKLIIADMLLIIQVLVNLLRNAASYSRENGSIDISINQWEGKVSFRITDEGPGVKESELPRLFDKFFRGANVRARGTGLGLSICKGIIDVHGGVIAAWNDPAGGFVCEFTLPSRKGTAD